MTKKKAEEEEKEQKEAKSFQKNVRNKSIRQLVEEAHKVVEEPVVSAQDEGVQKETTPVTPTAEDVPDKADAVIQTVEDRNKELEEFKKATAEAAKQASEESSKTLREEIQKIKESNLTAKEKKEEIEELKTNWTGFDPTTGQVTPKDYNEIVRESVRLAEEKAKTYYEEQIKLLREEIKKEQETEVTAQQEQQQKQLAEEKANMEMISGELEDLYKMGKLTKPKSMEDVNDPAAKEVADLFMQATEYNKAQEKAGKPIERSIFRFAHLYYKPRVNKQPAGADAPVGDMRNATPENKNKINYRDIHNLSFRQIIAKNAKRG